MAMIECWSDHIRRRYIPHRLFNTRRESKTVRALDFHKGDTIHEAALQALIVEAVRLNQSKAPWPSFQKSPHL